MKNKKKREIPSELIDGLLEIGFVFGAIVIALLFAIIIDDLKDIPFEALFMLGAVVMLVLMGIIFITVDLIKNRRRERQIASIYKALKDRYPVYEPYILTRRFDGVDRDIHLISGKNPDGKFELYKLDDKLFFSVEYFPDEDGEVFTVGVEPEDTEDAIRCIEEFMSVKKDN